MSLAQLMQQKAILEHILTGIVSQKVLVCSVIQIGPCPGDSATKGRFANEVSGEFKPPRRCQFLQCGGTKKGRDLSV